MSMKNRFLGKDFLTLMNYKREEINYLLKVAEEFKRKKAINEPHAYLIGRTIAMVFEKHSSRARFSFQAAMAHLGGQSFYVEPLPNEITSGEPVKDKARVIDRYCDALVIRTYSQSTLDEYAEYMENPVINALTDLTHPLQALAAILTIKEKKGKIEGKKLTYVGDPWNVCHSLMVASSLLGMNYSVVTSKQWSPSKEIIDFARENSNKNLTDLIITDDLKEGLKEADIIYINSPHGMGHKDLEERIKEFSKYQINADSLKYAKKGVIVLHCLPCYRGEEVTNEIIESHQSAVFDEAENRMHIEKAILSLVIK